MNMKALLLVIGIVVLLCSGELSGCFEQGKQNNTVNIEDTEIPTTPTNVQCTTPMADNIPIFIWDAASDTSDVSGYYVKIDANNDIWVGNTLLWKSTSAITNGTHTFFVKAKDGSRSGNIGNYGSCTFIISTSSIKKYPVAILNGPYAGFTNHSIIVNGSKSYDIDGNIINYTWNFGDGTILYGKIVAHSYNKSGFYTITLTVKDNDSLVNSNTTIANIIWYSDDGGGSGNTSTEPEKFTGSWHNTEIIDELWIFYRNGTRKTTSQEIDDSTQQPYFVTVWSFYEVANNKICFNDIDTPNEEPSICYEYAFSENNTNLAISFDGVVVISLERE
jgi:hypothetical protein